MNLAVESPQENPNGATMAHPLTSNEPGQLQPSSSRRSHHQCANQSCNEMKVLRKLEELGGEGCAAGRPGCIKECRKKTLNPATGRRSQSKSSSNNEVESRAVDQVTQNHATATSMQPLQDDRMECCRSFKTNLLSFTQQFNSVLDRPSSSRPSPGTAGGFPCAKSPRDKHEITVNDECQGDNMTLACDADVRNIDKGKEKLLCDDNNGDDDEDCASVTSAREGDNSNESIESMRHGNFKRKSRWCPYPKGRNKRFNNDNNDSCSGTLLRKGSSFLNWISNLTNSLKMLDDPDEAATPLVHHQMNHAPHQQDRAIPLSTVGFGFASVFQALYSPNTKKSNVGYAGSDASLSLQNKSRVLGDLSRPSIGDDAGEAQMPLRLLVAGDVDMCTSGPGAHDAAASRNSLNDLSCSGTREDGAEANRCSRPVGESAGGDFLENIWITRLLPKVMPNSLEPGPSSNHNDCCHEHVTLDKENDDLNQEPKLAGNFNHLLPVSRMKESEMMISVFAKRIGALRHVKDTDVQLNSASLPVTKSSCNGPWMMIVRSEEKHVGETCDGKHKEPAGKIEKDNLDDNCKDMMDEECKERKEAAGDVHRVNQIVHHGSSSGASDEQAGIFDTLRRLRLSRTDIIRLLRSSDGQRIFDGFVVRVRLGKWEEALGGTGYHVACIQGNAEQSKSCVSVSIRNTTFVVDYRFVSNHDFLEEELKAWWSAAIRGDCRAPSKEELDIKLQERELLGKQTLP